MMEYFGYNKVILAAVIPLTAIYFIGMIFLTTLNLRWFTIISSVL